MRAHKLKAQPRRLNGASVAVFAKILDAGTPTRFRFEAAVRHGIRVFLILQHGVKWQEADDNAAQVVKAAFWKLRIVRPTWLEGQPESTRLPGESRIFCANEACQKPIESDTLHIKLYCSEECRTRAKSKRGYADHREECVIRARVARAAARAMGEMRVCEWCGRQFQALDDNRRKQRFCGKTCRSRFASSCAASWRPYRLPSQRGRDGRFLAKY